MKILAIDSAMSACSTAVVVDGKVVAVERAVLPRGQAEALLPMIDRVRSTARIAFAELDRFAVTIGPGHFTGLRAGLAAARGLALAADRPLVGVSTLEAVAAAVPPEEREWAAGTGGMLLVALDSKLAEAYVQAFDPMLRALAPPAARPVADYAAEVMAAAAGRLIAVGDAAPDLAAALLRHGAEVRRSLAPPLPDAVTVAVLGAAAPVPPHPPAPLYIHPPRTTTPRPRDARR